MYDAKLGQLIKEKRKELNLTQTELGNKLNVTDKTISKWENGNSLPDLLMFNDICNVLGIDSHEVFDIDFNRNYDENSSEVSEEFIEIDTKNKKTNFLSCILLFILVFSFIVILIYYNVAIEVPFFILLSFFLILLYYVRFTKDNKNKKFIVLISCIIYSLFLISYSFYSGIFYKLYGHTDVVFGYNIIPIKNLIEYFQLFILKLQPFSLIFQYIIVDFCLFMPYSFFIPYILKERFKLSSFFLSFICLILLREFIQYITNMGVFDVDDIILNFTGLLISYPVVKLLKLNK